MIDSNFHIELDGNKYKIAESAEGAGYALSYEPLRAPNSQAVRGEAQAVFQVRDDVLLWNWTDWSQGEGQRVADPRQPGRSWQLNSVRVFEEPGHLIPGYDVDITKDSGGSSELAVALVLVRGISALYGFDGNAAFVYKWDEVNVRWGAAVALTGLSVGSNPYISGTEDNIYWMEQSTQKLWSWDGSNNPVTISTGFIQSSGITRVQQLNDYVYVYRTQSSKVWEIPKTGSAGITIDQWTGTGLSFPAGEVITTLDGRIYVMFSYENETSIREIVPTTAAGVGFGSEIALIKGVKGLSLWSHSGTLWLVVTTADTQYSKRSVMYLTPGGEYGTIGEWRAQENLGPSPSGGDGGLLDFFLVSQQKDASNPNPTLWQVDVVSGGMAGIGYDTSGTVTSTSLMSLTTFKGDVFWSTERAAGTKRTWHARSDRYAINSEAISPEQGFGLVGDKLLTSLSLSCEPLLSNWTINVDYRLSDTDSWVTAITYTTDNGTGTTQIVSTDSTAIVFERVQIRIRFTYTGGGVPSTAPVVLGVGVRATVVETARVSRLLLDLSNSQSAGSESKSGASKIDQLQATFAKKVPVDYKDGYTHRENDQYDQYDVIIDEASIQLSSPGEGVATVTLREVI